MLGTTDATAQQFRLRLPSNTTIYTGIATAESDSSPEGAVNQLNNSSDTTDYGRENSGNEITEMNDHLNEALMLENFGDRPRPGTSKDNSGQKKGELFTETIRKCMQKKKEMAWADAKQRLMNKSRKLSKARPKSTNLRVSVLRPVHRER